MTTTQERRLDAFDWLLASGWALLGLLGLVGSAAAAVTYDVPRSVSEVLAGFGALCVITALAQLRRWRSAGVLSAVSAVILVAISVVVVFASDIQVWVKIAVGGPCVVLALWTGVEVAFGNEG